MKSSSRFHLARRREPRFPVSVPATLTTFAENMEPRQVLYGVTKDISREGTLLAFSSPPPLQIGEFVKVELQLSSSVLHFYGRVIRIRPAESEEIPETLIHLHFTILEESSIKYLQSLLTSEVKPAGKDMDSELKRGE